MRYLDKYSAREKELRRLEREARRLNLAHRHAPVVPLERPFQRGWVKTFVLADGIDRRTDAQLFRTLLAIVNHRVWARDRSFVHHRTRALLVLRPRVIHYRAWEKLGWPASHQRMFEFGRWRVGFDELVRDEDGWWDRWVHGYKLAATWWLREDVQPHLITHQRVDLPEVKSRLAEIEAHMTRTCGWKRLDRLHGHGQWRRCGVRSASDERAQVHLHEQFQGDSANT